MAGVFKEAFAFGTRNRENQQTREGLVGEG